MSNRDRVLFAAVSLIVSIFLWVYVNGLNVPTKQEQFSLKVEARNLPPDTTILGSLPDVTITAEASPDQLEYIKKNKNEIAAFVDLSNAEPGTNPFRVRIDWPARFRAAWVPVPRELNVTIEQITRSIRNVTAEPTGALGSGTSLQLGEITTEPSKVSVVGTSADVKRVVKVRALLDLTKVQPGSGLPVTVEALGEGDNPIGSVRCDPPMVRVTAVLTPANNLRSLLVSPQWKGQPAFGYEIEDVTITPNQVSVKGHPGQLAKLIVLRTEPINIGGLSLSQTFSTRVVKPADTEMKTKTVRVFVKVRKIADTTPSVSGG